MLSRDEKREIDRELENYPELRAICVDGLKVVQRHRGWVDDDALRDVAEHLRMSVAELDSVATFYNVIFRRPVGRHVIRICNSMSCYVLEYERLLDRIAAILGIHPGETTADGRFTLVTTPCLGDCEHAPALMIDDDLHDDLKPDDIDALLDRYE